MGRICQIVVVCEDWRSSRFARSFLEAAGVDPRKLEDRPNPGGSGHDWVKRTFVQEVRALTRFSEGRGVLGLLDEDGQSVAVRQKQVADLLAERGLPTLEASEGRCLLLPARNIETWLYWLTSRQTGAPLKVDELTDYKRSGHPAAGFRLGNVHCHPAGAYLHTLNHAALPADCPSRLAQALVDLRRFLEAIRR